MGYDRQICPMDNPAKTPTARHQSVAQHVSSKNQLSTKTADRNAHARSCHHARNVWSAHIWEKQICLKIQQQQRNAKWFQSLLLPSFNSNKC